MVEWRVVGMKVLCKSKFISVFSDRVVLHSGGEIDFVRVEMKDYVTVLPVFQGKILMIEIFRYPTNCFSLELPSGHVEDGESPENSAFRELEEETGFRAGSIESLGFFYPLSRSTQKAYLFLAGDLEVGKQKLDDMEQIKVRFYEVEDVRNMLMDGKITHSPTLVALQKFLLRETSASRKMDKMGPR